MENDIPKCQTCKIPMVFSSLKIWTCPTCFSTADTVEQEGRDKLTNKYRRDGKVHIVGKSAIDHYYQTTGQSDLTRDERILSNPRIKDRLKSLGVNIKDTKVTLPD